MERLTQAIIVAAEAHDGQLDKAGLPYILHPLRVMDGVKTHGEDAMIVAVLHDTLEDTDLQPEYIRNQFGDDVLVAVMFLSRLPSQVYKNFILNIRDSKNELAITVKKADLMDNLSRIHLLPESERSIENRYRIALDVLNGK